MSDVKIKQATGRSTLPTDRAVAEKIFRVPTREEVVAAGFAAERWESIRDEQLANQKRFISDAAFRADVSRRYAEHLERKKARP